MQQNISNPLFKPLCFENVIIIIIFFVFLLIHLSSSSLYHFFFLFFFWSFLQNDVGLHGLGVHPPVQLVCTKIHCSVFQVNFLFFWPKKKKNNDHNVRNAETFVSGAKISPEIISFFFFKASLLDRVFPNLLPLPGIWKKLAREKICGKKLGTYLKCLCFGIFPKEVCSLFWIAPIIQIKQFSGIFIFTDVGYRAPAALPVPTSFYRQTLGPLYLTLTGFD